MLPAAAEATPKLGFDISFDFCRFSCWETLLPSLFTVFLIFCRLTINLGRRLFGNFVCHEPGIGVSMVYTRACMDEQTFPSAHALILMSSSL